MKWIKENKKELWVMLICFMGGVFASINSYGSLFYNRINIMSPLHLPLWDTSSHIIAFIVVPLFIFCLALLLSKNKNYFGKIFLFFLSILFSIFMLFTEVVVQEGISSYSELYSDIFGTFLFALIVFFWRR